MQIILSRKGFDSAHGWQPSPIMPDGTLLSLPIPARDGDLKFADLLIDGQSYYDIIKQLRPQTRIKENDRCHLDPDLRKSSLPREKKWLPLFGQAETAQSHLKKMKIKEGDLFLFFGWFREAEKKVGKLRYKKSVQDRHIIYGYLQIGSIFPSNNFPEHVRYHPHAQPGFKKKNNWIYQASDKLSFAPSYPGGGYLKYHENLVLTKEGKYSKGKWELPDFFRNVKITYHSPDSFKTDYFKSADIGQEFVVEENELVSKWAIEKIENSEV